MHTIGKFLGKYNDDRILDRRDNIRDFYLSKKVTNKYQSKVNVFAMGC